MALYADENFPLRVVKELRRLGQDVLTVFGTVELINPLLIVPSLPEQPKPIGRC